jgi:hypothetical protein
VSRLPTAGWETGRLVPVAPAEADDAYGYLQQVSDDHPLPVALRTYALAMQRASAQLHTTLPTSFGRVATVQGRPYVAFSREEWRRACALTRRLGRVALGRRLTAHRPGKKRALRTSRGLLYDRHAPVTHCTLQVSAALPRLPREGAYCRVWMLRTPPLRVEDDRAAGGEGFAAAYDDLWADLARRVEALMPTALADLVKWGAGA